MNAYVNAKAVSRIPDMSRDLTELAWCAGFFDGEGCMSSRRDPRYGSLCLCLSIGQSGISTQPPETLVRFQTAVGVGHLANKKRVSQAGRTEWAYQVQNHRNVQWVLCQIWPWLSSAKREQAHRRMTEYNQWRAGRHDRISAAAKRRWAAGVYAGLSHPQAKGPAK